MAGNLFVLPKQVPIDSGVVVPGAKATFSQTGTSTLQNTFTDIALSTPHANPVVADSNGVFAAVYFDPFFVDYRLKLTDANDVLIYQVDDVPASQTGQSLTLNAAAPFIDLIESDASANNGVWRIQVNSEQLTIQLGNDALSSFTNILTIDRTLNVVDTIDLLPTTLNYNGLLLGISTGSFTGTLTGYAVNPTGTVRFIRQAIDSTRFLVTMWIEAAITGTSNAITCTMTGLPAAVTPTTDDLGTAITLFVNNARNSLARCRVRSTNIITFEFPNNDWQAGLGQWAAGVFESSGTKGLPIGWTFTYIID